MSARFRLGFAAAVCACLLAGSAAAWPCHDYGKSVIHASGLLFSRASCSARMGSHELIGTNTGLFVVMDLADPFAPAFTDTLTLGGRVNAIAVAGTRAYVAAGTAGVFVVDVPAAGPAQVVGSYATGGDAWDVALDGTTAFVAAQTADVVVLDVGNPGAIVPIGTYATPGDASHVEFLNGYLVVRSGDYIGSAVRSVDMSDPASGVLMDEFSGIDSSAPVRINAVGDEFATWTTYNDGTDNHDTVRYRRVAADGRFQDVGAFVFPPDRVSLQTCYPGGNGTVGTIGRKGYFVLVDPQSAMELGTVYHGGISPTAPTFADGLLVACTNSKVEVWVADPGFETTVLQTVPHGVGSGTIAVGAGTCVETWSTTSVNDPDIKYQTYRAYVADGNVLGEWRWQISQTVFTLGSLLGVTPTAVVFNEPGNGGARVRDIATGDAVATLPLARAAMTAGSKFFAVNDVPGGYTFAVTDLSDPAAPVSVGSVPMPAVAGRIVRDGTLAFATNATPQATVLDLADLAAPAVLGQATFPWAPVDLIVRDGLGYAVGEEGGNEIVAVLDLSQPLAPAVLGTVVVPDQTRLAGLRGETLFATTTYTANVVLTLDVANPAAPAILGQAPMMPLDLAVTDDLIVAQTWRGPEVLALPCDSAVPTLIAGFTVTHRGGEVTVAWSAPGAGDAPRFRVIAAAGSRSWDVAVDDLGGAYRAVDRVTTGGDVSYAVQLWLDGAWTTVAYETVRVTPTAPTLTLAPATPNPFNPQTTIAYAVAQAGPVSLVVYDLAGRRVATLVDEVRPAGPGSVVWDGRDDAGRAMPAGIYAVRLVTPTGTRVQKVTMLK